MRWWVVLGFLLTACASDAPLEPVAADAGPQEPERSWAHPGAGGGYSPCIPASEFTLDNGTKVYVDGYCPKTIGPRSPISDPPYDPQGPNTWAGDNPGYPRPDPPGDPVPAR